MDFLFGGNGLSSGPDVSRTLLLLGIALALGAVLYLLCLQQSKMNQTPIWLMLVSPAIAALTLFLRDDTARAICLFAAVLLMRNNGWGFLSAATGMICGMQLPGYAALLVGITALAMLARDAIVKARKEDTSMRLSITIPEDLRIPGLFDDILKQYTTQYTMQGIRTVEMGMFFEMTYSLRMTQDADVKAFLNALRSLNGNLTVSLTMRDA